MFATLRGWPTRRWAAAAVIFPVVAVVLALAGGGHGLASWWSWPWLVLTGALGAVALATYVPAPGAGRLIDTGCAPCAAAAAVAVVAAVVAHATSPASPALAAVATGLTAVAAVRRLTDSRACQTVPSAPAR